MENQVYEQKLGTESIKDESHAVARSHIVHKTNTRASLSSNLHWFILLR